MKPKDVDRSRVHRLFYPVVTVAITARFGGRVGGMPAISCISLSFEPPLLGVSIQPDHQTYALVKGSGHFAVNFIDAKHSEKIANLAEVPGWRVENKLLAAGFGIVDGRVAQLPVVEEASAVIECRVVNTFKVGDHELFVGEVLAAYASDDFKEYWAFERYSPALYAGMEPGVKKRMKFVSIRP